MTHFCVMSETISPRPRHLVPLLGELDVPPVHRPLGRSEPTKTMVTQAHVVLRLLSRDRASPDARASADAQADLVLEAAASASDDGLASMEKGLSPVRWPCIMHKATTTSAARHIRVASVCPLLVPRDSERSGALACAPSKSRLCVGGRSWHVTARSCAE